MKPNTNERNSRLAWESYFAQGWEENDGRRQTMLFAKYFLETVAIPKSARTLLDVGCALGDALWVFHELYPELQLFGCDFSERSIKKAKELFGSIASFNTCQIDEIEGHYDIIYCSNTLEHFFNYTEISKKLLQHCKLLYVLVPYKEFKNGKPIDLESKDWHVATFYKNSFDSLVNEGYAQSIKYWIHPCHIAWSDPPDTIRNIILRSLRIIIEAHIAMNPYRLKSLAKPYKAEIFFEIRSKYHR